jgi:hypothetical protein
LGKKLIDARASRFDIYASNKVALPSELTDIDRVNFDYSTVRSMAIHPELHGGLVFKNGITTGTTMGLLVAIRHEYPPNWGLEGDAFSRVNLDGSVPIDSLPGGSFDNLIRRRRHLWLGFVKLLPGTKYSEKGDSGALVYTYWNFVKVPPGFHIGKPHDFGGAYAMFQTLECHILEANTAPYNTTCGLTTGSEGKGK